MKTVNVRCPACGHESRQLAGAAEPPRWPGASKWRCVVCPKCEADFKYECYPPDPRPAPPPGRRLWC
jgi:hypothetical protein